MAFCSVVNFLRFLGGMGTSSFCFHLYGSVHFVGGSPERSCFPALNIALQKYLMVYAIHPHLWAIA
ncbi:hypothetical protein AVDCRST_MAG81-825 [uncultured Synechococcales cyanobacterium]|uniref:Uncharacterized protein n=1 Tax=uncultured Synechococcales cyanobacterium TaxID=1936017 RepID=A0A6J4UYT8_9CYAN|nr:hypothetical protein AVDCRST_MAG81-825 [uncultured Synechococcales cyanobacterium]